VTQQVINWFQLLTYQLGLENSGINRVAINLLKTKRRLFYLKTQFEPRSKHFQLGYKNQSVCDVSGTSRYLFSDKYKTRKFSVDRAYES